MASRHDRGSFLFLLALTTRPRAPPPSPLALRPSARAAQAPLLRAAARALGALGGDGGGMDDDSGAPCAGGALGGGRGAAHWAAQEALEVGRIMKCHV